jgi:hypothetical protein
VVVFMGKFLPDVHRELHRVNVLGDVVAIELSIRGTFLGPFEMPAGRSSRRGPSSTSRPQTSGTCATARARSSTAISGVAAMFAQLGVLPDFTSAVAASAPPR